MDRNQIGWTIATNADVAARSTLNEERKSSQELRGIYRNSAGGRLLPRGSQLSREHRRRRQRDAASVELFPGVHTAGLLPLPCPARPGGQNAPYAHAARCEVGFVPEEGTLTTSNQLLAETITGGAGEVLVRVPRGGSCSPTGNRAIAPPPPVSSSPSGSRLREIMQRPPPPRCRANVGYASYTREAVRDA
ncbi:germin-like protein 1-1 [Panicum miliaceum]|uniref:Germin-like protein 1-1 n=1 Tax=Panicum miliaceum TaxID=4540 RepID=A0A3L6PTR3_PANMI|nr:germin-like protein 1-1 [Panicum miliaceum]